MSDVQFDEENFGRVKRPFDLNANQAPTGFEGLIIKLGLAKDSTQAKYVMVGMTVLFFILAIGIFFWSAAGGGPAPTTLPPNFLPSGAPASQ